MPALVLYGTRAWGTSITPPGALYGMLGGLLLPPKTLWNQINIADIGTKILEPGEFLRIRGMIMFYKEK